MRSKRFFSFRADQPLPNSRDQYCRFSLTEETYDSVDDARQRLANLHRASPDGPEDEEYRSAMRNGFRVGNVTYVLETDALVFWDEVQRLTKALANATQGAELSRAIIDHRRTNRWERVSQLEYPVATAPGTDFFIIAAPAQLGRSATCLMNTEDSPNAYLRVIGVDALAEELRTRGADIIDGPEDRTYGQRELVVKDCNGLILCFGEDTSRTN